MRMASVVCPLSQATDRQRIQPCGQGRQNKSRGQSDPPITKLGDVMSYKRGWVALMLFFLTLINYIDRATLSFAIVPISKEFGLSTVAQGYLFSSFIWSYTLC